MIYITLGTQACDFSRCLRMVEELMQNVGIKDRVIAQVGYTSYRPEGVECFDFVPEEKYLRFISDADVIISHAGTGALFSAIKKGKKVIAVARLAKYREMVNDHQTEIVKKLSGEGYILDGTDSIVDIWDKLESFTPRKYDFVCTLPNKIDEVLKEWSVERRK